jgi:hypothetical protein
VNRFSGLINKTIYQLDDQTKPASFAGEKVSVTGTSMISPLKV